MISEALMSLNVPINARRQLPDVHRAIHRRNVDITNLADRFLSDHPYQDREKMREMIFDIYQRPDYYQLVLSTMMPSQHQATLQSRFNIRENVESDTPLFIHGMLNWPSIPNRIYITMPSEHVAYTRANFNRFVAEILRIHHVNGGRWGIATRRAWIPSNIFVELRIAESQCENRESFYKEILFAWIYDHYCHLYSLVKSGPVGGDDQFGSEDMSTLCGMCCYTPGQQQCHNMACAGLICNACWERLSVCPYCRCSKRM